MEKHGGDPAAVLAVRAEMHRRLEAQGDLAGTLARLEKQAAEAERAAAGEARALRERRAKAAKELARVAAKSIDLMAEPGPSSRLNKATAQLPSGSWPIQRSGSRLEGS